MLRPYPIPSSRLLLLQFVENTRDTYTGIDACSERVGDENELPIAYLNLKQPGTGKASLSVRS